jgi:hypothetical protein
MNYLMDLDKWIVETHLLDLNNNYFLLSMHADGYLLSGDWFSITLEVMMTTAVNVPTQMDVSSLIVMGNGWMDDSSNSSCLPIQYLTLSLMNRSIFQQPFQSQQQCWEGGLSFHQNVSSILTITYALPIGLQHLGMGFNSTDCEHRFRRIWFIIHP